jgi:RNA polymerase sigma factor (sigma-70 family)
LEHVTIEPRLSQMSTQWAMVFQAHSGTPDEASKAATQLMCRYAGAVHRYLLKALKNPDAASELDQEFALRFLKGDFRHCDPKRGRFRDYVKKAVQNLINDYYRRKRPTVSLNSRFAEPAVEDSGLAQFEQQFLESWRNDLLDRAWNALSELERNSRQPYFTVLRSRVEYPDLKSTELAKRLSAALGRPLTAGVIGARLTDLAVLATVRRLVATVLWRHGWTSSPRENRGDHSPRSVAVRCRRVFGRSHGRRRIPARVEF